jgi:hypothetical protein
MGKLSPEERARRQAEREESLRELRERIARMKAELEEQRRREAETPSRRRLFRFRSTG